MLLWVKTVLAKMMEAIGIAWTDPTQVSDGDKLNFIVGSFVGLAGLFVGTVALVVSARQSRIAARHDEILQAEIAQKTNIWVWPAYGGVPDGWCSLSAHATASVAPMEITTWKLVIKVSDVQELESLDIIEQATHTRLELNRYDGLFAPADRVVNYQVVSTAPITIPVGGFAPLCLLKYTRPEGEAPRNLEVVYELYTKYRTYMGFGDDIVNVLLPYVITPLPFKSKSVLDHADPEK